MIFVARSAKNPMPKTATPPAIMVPTGPLIAEATAVNAAARAAGLTEEAAKSAAVNPTVKSM